MFRGNHLFSCFEMSLHSDSEVDLVFPVAVYTSPIEALGILEKKSHDVDFVMVAVDMEELNGFQFLEAAKDMHRNLQVISMFTNNLSPTACTCFFFM